MLSIGMLPTFYWEWLESLTLSAVVPIEFGNVRILELEIIIVMFNIYNNVEFETSKIVSYPLSL